ncbi:chemotaxis protein CheC [Lachnospiraceae bacterium XBB1006]|nr:chemotaxis protein CheC [Lachnospiraceae bacterium XBB1006]
MTNYSLEDVNNIYFDVLKEIGNIGAGNATTAIASMLQLRLDMNVPKVQLLSFPELGGAVGGEETQIVGIYLEVGSDISGSMMFLLTMESARFLVNKMMMKEGGSTDSFDEIEMSALKEVGNIIAGSYLSALASMTQLTITPSVPYLAIDMAAAILSVPAIQFGQYGDNALLIQTEFGDDVMIDGYFILLPDLESYGKILSSLGIQV